MYHHRYQPPINSANKTAALASHNKYPNNHSYPSSSSSATKSSSFSRRFNANHTNSTRRSNHSSSYSFAPTSRSVGDRQDVIFRKVRGILNKITPETFDKLTKELVNVGLDSPRTLRGVIYLLFDKALKDLKYSSLYAKLCQELSEKAPNFEVEPGPNTFCKFLISKCEDEFERRRRATEDFDRKYELTDEEFEQRSIAKRKMLGNIKFICELGKKRLLQEEILHECIRGLLSKKKERSLQDQAQDLECLCQIMRTIGSLLDVQASRNLMNQYFERIDMFSKKPELPSRIRFMLRDIIDLRNNNWRPRPFQREDNVPQPLSKLREEAKYDPNSSSSIDKFGNNRNLIGISDLSKLHGNKLSLLLDDEPSFTTSTDFHWGPSFLPLDNPFDPFSSGATTHKSTPRPATTSTSSMPVSSSQSKIQVTEKASNFRVPDRVSNWRKGSNFSAAQQPSAKPPAKETVKPPMSTSILPRQLPKISDTKFSLRPSHNLISARASIVTSKPVSDNDNASLPSNSIQSGSEANKISAGDQSLASVSDALGAEKPATNGSLPTKDTLNKSARDFHVNKFISALSEQSEENSNVSRIVSKVRELKIPKSYQPDCLVSAIRQSIFKTESDRENTRKHLTQIMNNTFEPVAMLNAFKIIFEQLQALEAEVPKVKSLVAGFLSQAILDGSLSLEEVGGVLGGGRHHPLFLLCLQKLENCAGQAWLNENFVKSKIDLMAMLPEVDRSKDRLASVLKDRCLGFLDPMLTIEPDLWEQMKNKDPTPSGVYRWIKDNVSPSIQGTPTFAHVLVTCLVRYIHSMSAEKIRSSESQGGKGEETPQSNKSSPSSASQGTADIEKELLSKYQQILQSVLKDKQLQLATLYSLQSFYHSLDFPKGALLRWFHQMYDLNIVDDDVFFIWKEEINDKFPGKGQALFQVNTWLNWLALAESSDEEGDEDEV